jgi:hypothetical protein
MRLPDDSIGISDLNDYLACPRRTEFKLRRFTEGKEPPEARGKAGVRDPTSAYGSAIHDAIFLIEEEAYRPDEAAEAAFQKWAQWLEPSDLKHLEDDLATYLRRDVRGVETVVNEGEFKVPLLSSRGARSTSASRSTGCTAGSTRRRSSSTSTTRARSGSSRSRRSTTTGSYGPTTSGCTRSSRR